MQQIRELPLATRNTLSLVATVPGMRIDSTQSAGERSTYVQGMGRRNNVTNFQLDGVDTNAPMDEGGTAIPNVDTIAEFSVQTNSFSAELGRDPVQVLVVTKSGSNQFHGTAYEFVQNDVFNARNTFSTVRNLVRYNQFGGAGGGPIKRNKTFFFTSFQATPIRNATISLITLIGIALFAHAGIIRWLPSLIMMVGAFLGGYLMIKVARSVPRIWVRWGILAWSVALTAIAFWRYG